MKDNADLLLLCEQETPVIQQTEGVTLAIGPTVKLRIPSLTKEVRVRILDEAGIRDVVSNSPFGDLVGEYEVSFVMDSDDEESNFVTANRVVGYMRIMDVVWQAVVDFDTKILPVVSEAEPEVVGHILKELYGACVRVNPALDMPFFNLSRTQDPLEADVEDALKFLPTESLSDVFMSIILMDTGDIVARSDDFEEIMHEALCEIPQEQMEANAVSEPAPELAIDEAMALSIESELQKRVVGQRLAISHVGSVVKRMATGFRDETRPPAVMLFAGPTGVGKTLVAKESAKLLFGADAVIGRIDCSGLAERHHSNKLFGAPPGYLGYPDTRDGSAKDKDPAILYTETKGMEAGGILLLDEIEKAHPDIWDAFLTVFDEGYAKTSAGNKIDFRNILIVMTTNLGSREFRMDKDKRPLGFTMHSSAGELVPVDHIRKTATKALEGYMKPEIVGRITEVVPFIELSEDEMRQVVDLEWIKTSAFIKRKASCDLELDVSVKDRIATLSASKGYGARLVGRLLDLYVVDPLAEFYLSGNKHVFDDPEEKIIVKYDDVLNSMCVASNADPDHFTCDIKESSLVA